MAKWIEDLKNLPEFGWAAQGLIGRDELMVAIAKKHPPFFPLDNSMIDALLVSAVSL